ncbi:hypothetical protein IAT38_001625 [Cryptococcus sp. DSM 104549]
MADAGPSRRRRSNDGANGTQYTQSQKRHKITDAAEIFAAPDQEKNLKVGREYRLLQDKAEEMKADMVNATTHQLIDALGAQSQLFTDVRDTGLGTLDANLMKTNTENAMGLAKKFKIDGVTFDIDEYLIRVKGLLGLDRAELMDQDVESDDELDDSQGAPRARKGALGDWEKIGWMAAKFSRRVPGIEFMYGPMIAERKERKVGQRQKRAEEAPEVRPATIESQKKSDVDPEKDATTMAHDVYKKLLEVAEGGEGINMFKLVINPRDFGQTVENCFYVSFLIKEGRVGVGVAPDGEIMIFPAAERHPTHHGEQVRNQAVLELDMETWRLAIETFHITESLIPHRIPKVDPPRARAAAGPSRSS